MRAMQVSAFSLPDTVGGTQVMLAAISRTLVSRGHEVTVFRFAAEGLLRTYETSRGHYLGAEVVSVGNDFSDLDSFRKLYRNDRIDAVFEAELLRLRPDVVHVHHLTCLSTGILDVLRRHGVPVVLSLWDFWLGCPRGQRIQDNLELCRKIDRKTCARCCARLWPQLFDGGGTEGDVAILQEYDAWIRRQLDEVDILAVPSASTRDEYRAWGLLRDKIDIVPCGLERKRFGRPGSARGTRLRVAYIGSVIPSKGAHVLVEAVQRLDPTSVQLDVFGEAFPWHGDAGYVDRLRALDCGSHQIRLHGRYEPQDVPGILANVDVLVVPGLWFETFCLTIREGFLAGVPVVTSRLGATAEAVEHEVTGLLVEPDDVEELAKALGRLRDDPALADRLASAPKPIDDTKTMVARFADLYDRALAVHARPGTFA